MTYDEIIQKINGYKSDTQSWKSDYTRLLEIISAAENMGIEPQLFEGFSITKLREICPKASKLAKLGGKDELEKLLQLTSSQTITELRTDPKRDRRERIKVTRETIDDVEVFTVRLSKAQMEKVQRNVKRMLAFDLD